MKSKPLVIALGWAKVMKRPVHKRDHVYTHRDKSRMLWRLVGMRPVSELADQVMDGLTLPPKARKPRIRQMR